MHTNICILGRIVTQDPSVCSS